MSTPATMLFLGSNLLNELFKVSLRKTFLLHII